MIDDNLGQLDDHEEFVDQEDLDAFQDELLNNQDQLDQQENFDENKGSQVSGDQSSGAQESDLELKKKVVLYYHELVS